MPCRQVDQPPFVFVRLTKRPFHTCSPPTDEIRALPVVVFEGSPAQRASVASSGTAASLQGQGEVGRGGGPAESWSTLQLLPACLCTLGPLHTTQCTRHC